MIASFLGTSFRSSSTTPFIVIAWATAVLSTGACSLSEQKTITKPSTFPAEISLKAHAVRGPEGEVYVLGSTNLPDGFKLSVNVESRQVRGSSKLIDGDDNVIVRNGQFHTRRLWTKVLNPYLSYYTPKMLRQPDGTSLRMRNKPLPAGKAHVHFEAHFTADSQPASILSLVGGEGGKRLRGKNIRPTDPDVVDSDKALDELVTIDFPDLSPEARAIGLVKSAVLTVPGSGRSATDIEGNVDLFMSVQGFRRAGGWSAQSQNSDTYQVAFDFINGKAGEVQALWTINLRTGIVSYINMSAKSMSWTPKD